MNRNWKTVLGASLFFAATITGTRATAQASPTADLKSGIMVFAGGSALQPQPEFYKNTQKAYLFGADYTRYIHKFYVDPSLEVRALISPIDEEVGENVYSGGLKLEHAYGRFHPYGDFLVGSGTIKFAPYSFYYGNNNRGSDNSIVLTYGGGVDVDVWRNLGLKADFQGSHWNTGGTVVFHPRSYNLAVTYRFGSRRR